MSSQPICSSERVLPLKANCLKPFGSEPGKGFAPFGYRVWIICSCMSFLYFCCCYCFNHPPSGLWIGKEKSYLLKQVDSEFHKYLNLKFPFKRIGRLEGKVYFCFWNNYSVNYSWNFYSCGYLLLGARQLTLSQYPSRGRQLVTPSFICIIVSHDTIVESESSFWVE